MGRQLQQAACPLIKQTKDMRTVTFLLFLFISLASHAAETDSVKLQVHYAMKVIRYIEEERPKDDEMVLEIGNNHTHFYSRYSVGRRQVRDSVHAAGGTAQDVQNALAQSIFPRSAVNYQIWTNYPSTGTLTFTDNVFRTFKYTEPMQRPTWKTTVGDTTIVGYSCHKAVTHFQGRTWIVWYTPDIPVPEGPWKLCGLPGLILQADDSDHFFSVSCIGIKVNPKKTIEFPKGKSSSCSKAEYIQLVKQQWQDPDAVCQKVLGFKIQGYDAHGKKIVRTPKTAVLPENE